MYENGSPRNCFQSVRGATKELEENKVLVEKRGINQRVISSMFSQFQNEMFRLIAELRFTDPDFSLVQLEKPLARIEEALVDSQERITENYSLTAGHGGQETRGGRNRGHPHLFLALVVCPITTRALRNRAPAETGGEAWVI